MILIEQQNAAGWYWSNKLPVVSGIPQGSVLGFPLFLAFINDLPAGVSLQTCPTADDGILYRPIRHFSYCEDLQNDLDKLAQWEQQWIIQFHPSKYNSISVTRSKTNFKYNYILKGHTLNISCEKQKQKMCKLRH